MSLVDLDEMTQSADTGRRNAYFFLLDMELRRELLPLDIGVLVNMTLMSWHELLPRDMALLIEMGLRRDMLLLDILMRWHV
jgi:hypothetical protein